MTRPDVHPEEASPSFVEILRERADRLRGKTAFTFLAESGRGRDEAEPDVRLTFAELDLRARAIAAELQDHGLAGERALLLYSPGLEFIAAFFGCLYAGVAAVPANLPRPNRPMPRLRAIVADAEPRAILTARSLLPDSEKWIDGVPALAGLHRVATDDVDSPMADRWEPVAPDRDALAFLQYTSGSTATPKGVMISHGNLIANSAAIRACFGSTESSRGVFWLPLFHDMGLIGGVLQTIDCGGSSLLISPVAFLQRPRLWLEAIGRTGATISGGPDFAYDLCVRKIPPDQRAGLDLSTWSVAFNGAEPIHPETLDRFAEAFAPCGFRREAFLPCYGLAESTLLVSGKRGDRGPAILAADVAALGEDRIAEATADARRLVSSGGVPEGQEVVIVDPKTRSRAPADRVGEIWVRGPSVASGYWNRPEATETTFRARLDEIGGAPYLRTGDLGFLRDGELFVTGRLKDLIIVRGRNIYPQDVEWTVTACHPALRPAGAAAFSVEIEGRERLVVVAEVERLGKNLPADEILDSIRRAVPEWHELDVHAVRLIRAMSLPRTSSGKVQRHACREAFLGDSLDAVASWTRSLVDSAEELPAVSGDSTSPALEATGLEAWLCSRLANVLRVAAAEIDPMRPIAAYGLDSLAAMEMKAAIDAELKIDLPLTALLDGPSISDLAETAAKLAGNTHGEAASDSVAIAEDALSVGQQSLWYAHQLSPNPGTYNIAGAARIRAEIDVDAFRRAIQRLVDRHEALRSSFPVAEGRPVRRVLDHLDARVFPIDAAGWSDEDLERARDEEAKRPFDLENGPLHRVFLWSRSPREHDVLLVIHHIIGDFWTTAIILDEFAAYYAAERDGVAADLKPLPLRYDDHVRWQAEKLSGSGGSKLAAYWRNRLAGPLPELELPTDRPRPAVRSQKGAIRTLELDEAQTRALAALAESRGASLYVTLLAALQVLLSRYSGQDDVIVGSPVAGRTRAGLEGVVGYFVNLVPMRADLSGNPTFEAFLARVRSIVHEGLEHQDYPFGRMVEDLAQTPDPSRTPIFSVMFIYQKAQRLAHAGLTPFALSIPGHRLDLGGLPLESLALDKHAALFDLTMMAAVGSGRLSFTMEFSTDLFDVATIDRLLGHYRALLSAIAAGPTSRIGAISIIGEEERRALEGWSRTGPDLSPPCESVLSLFERHAATRPEQVAVAWGEDRLTYRELNDRADRLARRLRRRGVGPGRLVGLCCERSPELMVGLLGILKAGGAYVPLDPSHPKERIAFVLADAGVPFVVAGDDTRSRLEPAEAEIIELDRDESRRRVPALSASRTTESRNGHSSEDYRGNGNGHASSGQNGNGHAKNGHASAKATPVEASTPNRSGDPAYAVYTSGSTGTPKGVMVGHGGLLAAFAAWESAYALRPTDRHLQMAGVAFDVFAGDWSRALGSGATLVLCPRDVLLDPEALADLLERERVTVAEFVPAVVEGLVSHLERTGRTLERLRLVAVGSDVWHAGLYERLRCVLSPTARVVNSYGLTEATVDSTYFEGSLAHVPPDRPVPIGRPFAGTTVHVLDRFAQPLPAGVPGDLCLGGPCVAIGYVGRPALTAERFIPDPFSRVPGSRLYRTGDLARWRADGTLELLGRGDGQVKIRGYRIELGEVESVLRRHPSVREAAVVVRDEGERRLAAYIVSSIAIEPAELRRWLKDALPDYMVPASFTLLDRLPLSANGKVDRRTLAAIEPPRNEPETPRTAPRNADEATLERIVAEALGVEAVGVDDNLFDLGTDSILIIQIVSRARAAGLALDPIAVFRTPTIAELVAGLSTREPSRETDVDLLDGFAPDLLAKAREEGDGVEDVYPLTPVQEGMLFHSLVDPEAGAYVEQFSCRIRGELDEAAFVESWARLVARHPALRTSLRWIDADRPVQVVHGRVDLPVDRQDWREAADDEQEARLADYLRADRLRGFIPTFAPLMRLALIRLGDRESLMIWTSHHMIVDGWCVPILLGEALEIYAAIARGREPSLPPSRRFRDYVAWLRRQDFSAAEAYWKRALAGYTGPTPLGIERTGARGPIPAPPFGEVEAWLDPAVSSQLRTLARTRRITLATLIQGAWSLLLSRYSGRPDVTFGVTVSGRPADLEGVESIVGVLINTLPMRVVVEEEAEIIPWLAALQTRQAEMRRFESSPLVRIQEWSGLPRGRPLFESIVIVQNTPADASLARRASGLGLHAARMDEQTSYPLTVTVVPGESLHVRIGFDARRFEISTLERMLAHLLALLEGLATAPDRRLADLAMDDATAPVPGLDPVPSQLDRLSDEEIDLYLMELGRSVEGDLV